MVLSDGMKKKLKVVFFWAALLLVVFIMLNLVHLIWYLSEVEGFWSFIYFIKATMIALVLAGLLIMLAFAAVAALLSLFWNFPRGFTKKNVLTLLSIVVGVPLFFGFDFVTVSLPDLIFYRNISDRYKYLHQSERYLRDNDLEGAMETAIAANEKAFRDRTPWPVFVFSGWYVRSTAGQYERAQVRYAAAINHAYCMAHVDSLRPLAAKKYLGVLKMCDQPLLSRQPGYRIFPLTELVKLNLKASNLAVADYYNIQLLGLSGKINAADLAYFSASQSMVAAYATRSGDMQTASSVLINTHRLYKQKAEDLESREYLMVGLQGVYGYLLGNKLAEAGSLLESIRELAEDRKKSTAYLRYLWLKARYLRAAAAEGMIDEELMTPRIFDRMKAQVAGKKTIAEQYADRIIEVLKEHSDRTESKFGANSEEYVASQTEYASFFVQTGRFKQALSVLEALLTNEILKQEPLRQQRNLILLLKARCELIINKQVPAPALLDNYAQVIYSDAIDNLPYFTEHERDLYASRIQERIQLVNALIVASSPATQAAAKIYNNVLATRNLALSANIHLRTLLQDSSRLAFRKAYSDLLSQRGTQSSPGLELLIQEKQLIHQIRRLAGFKPYDPQTVTWMDVRNHLTAKAAAVEFITIPSLTASTPELWYYALVLAPDTPGPVLIRLCEEKKLAALLNRGGPLKQSTDAIYTQSLSQLRELLMHPVLKIGGSPQVLYLSLTGLLHQISFAALLDQTGVDYEIVSSTRLLTSPQNSQPDSRAAVVMGGIDFGSVKSIDNYRTVSSRDFAPLPYSYQEAVTVQRLLKANQYQATLVSGSQATEALFKRLSGKNLGIIHLSTHGIFEKRQRLGDLSSNDNSSLFAEDASMARCKLLFAGSNYTSDGSVTVSNDGYVTAQDISRMNFQNTELVVLSACESGLGVVRGTEGVQGFQRAFSLAGARYTLLSLWPVPDKQTAELMQSFYYHLFAGKTKAQALAIAQGEIRTKYQSPFYWAGFTLIRGL